MKEPTPTAIPNRNHTNERAYADGDPEDGKHTTNPVAIQSNECLAENSLEIHKSIRLSGQSTRARFYNRFGRIVFFAQAFWRPRGIWAAIILVPED
ncbi:MAG: hypothetical protein DMG97_43975 [Acidobacteria bacterium]|nr:MAG: hypothetical protein DMG97_43975 [Acidobacteriota bacterium]